jgi:hypothetical protein
MPQFRFRTLIVGALAPFAFIACADGSLVAPQAASHDVQYATRSTHSAAIGNYQLSVYATEVGTGAVLDAYVLDASGNPATSGTAVFYYCSLRGNPAPSEACLTGSGRWARYGSAGIIPAGDKQGHALMGFTESQPAGTTVGFHFKFNGSGTGIASAWSDNVADYTWP